jgi:hypothetical protein
MQIGETVSAVMQMQNEGKCVICSQSHADPKKEKIKTIAPGNAGWHRKTMTGIFESDGTRERIYPSGFPPPYSYQGHHALALSALVKDANTDSPKDKRIRLNYYLDKIGYYPNRPCNVIGLPARKGAGDFEAFWRSIDLDKPLQLHGPGHDDEYFARCDALLADLVLALTDLCKELDTSEWESLLDQTMKHGENYAFKNLARGESGWVLHAGELATAKRLYSAPKTVVETVRAKTVSAKVRGYGKKQKDIKFPDPKLDTGPFA